MDFQASFPGTAMEDGESAVLINESVKGIMLEKS
jgi:hypothetical protein